MLLAGELSPADLRQVALQVAAQFARMSLDPVVVEADFHGRGWEAEDSETGTGLGDALREPPGRGTPDPVAVGPAGDTGAILRPRNGAGRWRADVAYLRALARRPGSVAVEPTGAVAVEASLRKDADGNHGAGAEPLFAVVRRGRLPSEPALALASDAYRSLVRRLAEQHAIVLVVAPATDWQTELLALAASADAWVLFVPPWVPHDRAGAMSVLRRAGSDSQLLLSVFGDPGDLALTASLWR